MYFVVAEQIDGEPPPEPGQALFRLPNRTSSPAGLLCAVLRNGKSAFVGELPFQV